MNESTRLEAFSDGVLAIAITLLVLDLRVPAEDPHGLAYALAHQWPSYLAYVVSFLVIGIIWVNHHALFSLVRQVDRLVLFTNLLLLMVVAAIPFPTRLLAEYLLKGDDAHVAAAVYSATMLAMSVAFIGLWLAVSRDAGLLERRLDRATRRATVLRFGIGLVVYAATIGLAFVSAIATLVVHGAIALYYCFDQLASRRRTPVRVES